MRDGGIDRYRVEEDGSAALVQSSPAPWTKKWAFKAALLGWLVALSAIVVGSWLDSRHRPPPAAWTALVVIGMALFFLAALASERADNLLSRLKREHEPGRAEWHVPTNLHDWIPRTSEQLATVERIANEHDGVALLGDHGSRTVDVYAIVKGRTERFWVDENGRAELVDAKPAGARYFLERTLYGIFLSLWVGLLAIGMAGGNHKGALLVAAGAALVVVLVAGTIVERPNSLEQRRKRLEAAGQPWIEIRTRPEDNSE